MLVVTPRYRYCVLMARVPPSEIEFNLTGSYGSPIHTNHNSNYSSMPSPDMDQSERKQQHDQSRRPLSVATDNMMLEFYKKDGYAAKCILLLPTSHSLAPSLFPPTPPLRHLILGSYIWSMYIKKSITMEKHAPWNLEFSAPVYQKHPYIAGLVGGVCKL